MSNAAADDNQSGGMPRTLGRLLCFGLSFLFMAGAVPLFNFGEVGRQIWAVAESVVTPLANSIGVWPWLAMWILGFFVFAGPMALIWWVVGNKVNRTLWFFYGFAAYGIWWLSGYWPL